MHKVAVEIHLGVGNPEHIEREQRHGIVGLHVRILGVVLADKITAMLCAVIAVFAMGAGLVEVEDVVIPGGMVLDMVHPHPGIEVVDRLHAAVFIAGRENQGREMLVDGARAHKAGGMGKHHGVVEAAVLGHHHPQVGVYVAYAGVSGVDVERELLVAVIVVDVGARGHGASYRHYPLLHHEPHLQQYLLRGILGIDPQQVVARYLELEIAVGQVYGVMHIMGRGQAREGIILDVGIVEAVKDL